MDTNSSPKLKIDWCSQEAARYACKRYHYSRTIPVFKTCKIGVWEDGNFKGAVVFGIGSNRHMGNPYGLQGTEVCELARVALTKHHHPVTKIIRIAIKMMKKENPGIRLIVSYADTNQGHLGKIYQAGNWIYVGEHSPERGMIINGKLIHRRTINSNYKTSALDWVRKNLDPNAKILIGRAKHKYLMPLDNEIKGEIMRLSKPYPTKIADIE